MLYIKTVYAKVLFVTMPELQQNRNTMEPKSFWPENLVDWAQVLGAAATAAAVIVTLYISRKDQRENLRGFIGYSRKGNTQGATGHSLNLHVTNCGVRPASIEVAHIEYPSNIRRWIFLRHKESSPFYFRLEDDDAPAPFAYGQTRVLACALYPRLVEHVHTVADARRVHILIDTTTDTRVVAKPDQDTANFIWDYAQKCRSAGKFDRNEVSNKS
jgi:hypothetical protein